MPEITSSGFLTRHIIEHLTSDRRVRHYRCNTLQNPLAFFDGQRFAPVDIATVRDAATDKAGAIFLRDRNIVSVGIKQADDAEKFIGLRPDERQDGSEQLEFSLEQVEVNGRRQTIDMRDKRVLSPRTMAAGPLLVQSRRQRTRLLLPLRGADEGFKVALRLHAKGLTVKHRADLDEYWFFNERGKFRFRLGKPYLVGLEGGAHEPLDLSEHGPLNMVSHRLIDNGDGTFTYLKEPGPDFGRIALPNSFWVDADTVYSDTADGRVNIVGIATWSGARDATDGTRVDDALFRVAAAVSAGVRDEVFSVYRSFFYFSLTGLSGYVTACRQYLYGYGTSTNDIIVQEGTQASTVSTADFDAFTGSAFGASSSWSNGAYNYIDFNSAGQGVIEDALGGTAKTCVREEAHDYDDVAPDENYWQGFYYADNEGTDYDPYLYVTTQASPPAGSGVAAMMQQMNQFNGGAL